MTCQNQLNMIDVDFRRQKRQDDIPHQKRMQTIVQLIDKHDTAMIQDLFIQRKHLSGATGFVS